MSTQNFVLNQLQQPAIQEDIRTSAQKLGAYLKDAPVFQAFQEASRAANENEQVTGMYKEIQDHQNALQWGRGNFDEHQQAIKNLSAEFEKLPLIQAYNQTLQEARTFFVEVDEIISEAAGVPFAVNAKKSCCG